MTSGNNFNNFHPSFLEMELKPYWKNTSHMLINFHRHTRLLGNLPRCKRSLAQMYNFEFSYNSLSNCNVSERKSSRLRTWWFLYYQNSMACIHVLYDGNQSSVKEMERKTIKKNIFLITFFLQQQILKHVKMRLKVNPCKLSNIYER